jgi:hypothetical protein
MYAAQTVAAVQIISARKIPMYSFGDAMCSDTRLSCLLIVPIDQI